MTVPWKTVAFGQLCSFLTALTGPSSAAMAARGLVAPTAQNAPAYALMAALWPAATKNTLDEVPAFKWLLLGLVDVEANTLVVLAYKYTTLTSIALLDCFAIPCCMVLSVAFLDAKYDKVHAAGALVCFLGIGLTVLSDIVPPAYGGRGHHELASNNMALGDVLALAGSALYAATNVAQEATVKRANPATLLSRLGVAGLFVSTIQAAILGEFRILEAILPTSTIAALAFVGYAITLASFYLAASHFFRIADAAAFNLSLLTSDVWAVLYTALVFRQFPPPLYFVAFACTATGVVIYHSSPPPTEVRPSFSSSSFLRRRRVASSSASSPTRIDPLLDDDDDDEHDVPATTPDTNLLKGGGRRRESGSPGNPEPQP
ncbi:hypothetical protein CTAYLR_001537 [Chrysophaeum taylorii]|uniref:Uncharacterized protein n=1 Tax=Chrysophaeum taylorii TaxID=2483200 RepID=A0AAD7UDB5_9STRA|nr:hypothetical protein CTAYLR_001537 [Chrysophaeum taylorii]